MNYNNFSFAYRHSNNITIEHVKKCYHSTPGGNFQNKPFNEYAETVTPEFYENFVKSVSFFNGFMGGSCRAYWSYTAAGYIPIKVVTVSPGRVEKYIDTFTFKFN